MKSDRSSQPTVTSLPAKTVTEQSRHFVFGLIVSVLLGGASVLFFAVAGCMGIYMLLMVAEAHQLPPEQALDRAGMLVDRIELSMQHSSERLAKAQAQLDQNRPLAGLELATIGETVQTARKDLREAESMMYELQSLSKRHSHSDDAAVRIRASGYAQHLPLLRKKINTVLDDMRKVEKTLADLH